MAVDLDDGCVDHGVLHVRLVRTGLEKSNENIAFDPIAVSLEDGVPVAEEDREVAPRAARSRHPQNRFDKTSVVTPAPPRVSRLAQAMRLHFRPLGVRQHESFHPKLESRTSFKWNPESQQTLEHWGLPKDKVFLVLRNGRDVTPGLVGAEVNVETALEDGDVIAFSGPVPYSYGYGAPVV
jgi:hypothetical protein